jgi:hypothetical protein
MNPFYIGLPGWAVCAFAAYAIRERAIGRLSAEQIGQVTLAQRSDRISLLMCSAVILVIFLALRFSLPGRQNLWFVLLLAATAAVSVYFEVKACKSIVVLLPSAPARTLVVARGIALLGLLCLVGAMAATVL